MDRLVELFEQLAVPEVARLLRRTAIVGIVFGIVIFTVAAILGYALVGFGACIGLGLGLANIRLVVGSVSRISADQPANPKRVIASRTAYRLGITTVVIIGLAVLSIQLGFGTAAGIALFYLLLVVNFLRAFLHSQTGGLAA